MTNIAIKYTIKNQQITLELENPTAYEQIDAARYRLSRRRWPTSGEPLIVARPADKVSRATAVEVATDSNSFAIFRTSGSSGVWEYTYTEDWQKAGLTLAVTVRGGTTNATMTVDLFPGGTGLTKLPPPKHTSTDPGPQKGPLKHGRWPLDPRDPHKKVFDEHGDPVGLDPIDP